MKKKRLGIVETYRLLNEDPVAVYRYIGWRDKFHLGRMLFRRYATVTDPDHIKHVLVTAADKYRKTPIARALLEPILGRGLLTSEGDFWRRQRRIAAPAFHHKRVRDFADMMAAATRDMLVEWRAAAAAGRPIEVQSEMSRLTMRIISQSMFSSGLDDADARAVSQAIGSFSGGQLRLRDIIGLPEWLPRRQNRVVRRAIATIDGIVNRIIAERRAEVSTGGGDHGDLLSMLMLARDEETGETMSDRQLRDEVMTVFIAGHETTATALTWIFYALHENPQVERRLHAVLDEALGGKAPGFEDLERVPYVRMVIEEAMRLYPPVPQIARQATAEDWIDGVRVPKGSIINMNIWLAHRHPKVWQDPERFDPDRFDAARAGNRHKFIYMPFGIGSRVCIGNSFAMLEAQILLATVAQAYRLRLAEGHTVKAVGNIVLRPAGGLPMTLEARPAG